MLNPKHEAQISKHEKIKKLRAQRLGASPAKSKIKNPYLLTFSFSYFL